MIFSASAAYTIPMNPLKSNIIKGILFVSIAGTLAHFVYEWSNNNYILGFFFPVNESTWEHMKLFFFPMLLFSVWMNQKLKEEYPCVTGALLAGTLLGTFLIPVLFYTYSGILGKNVPVLDIATFFISVIAAFCYLPITHHSLGFFRHRHPRLPRFLLFSGNQYISHLDIRHYHHSVADCFFGNILDI